MNPAYFIETGSRGATLRLPPLEYYALLGPLVGDKVAFHAADMASDPPTQHAWTEHTFCREAAVRALLGPHEPAAVYAETKDRTTQWMCNIALQDTSGFR